MTTTVRAARSGRLIDRITRTARGMIAIHRRILIEHDVVQAADGGRAVSVGRARRSARSRL